MKHTPRRHATSNNTNRWQAKLWVWWWWQPLVRQKMCLHLHLSIALPSIYTHTGRLLLKTSPRRPQHSFLLIQSHTLSNFPHLQYNPFFKSHKDFFRPKHQIFLSCITIHFSKVTKIFSDPNFIKFSSVELQSIFLKPQRFLPTQTSSNFPQLRYNPFF